MDPKEIKASLKAAREAIRSKEFKDAAKQCKVVLAADSGNYNALVFLGVAAEGLEQVDQALKAYRKATEQQPEQLLAWQGISSMLDKNADLMTCDESIEVFQKLAALHASDQAKQMQQLHKLLDLYTKSDQNDKALEVIDKILDVEKESEKRMKPLCSLVSLMAPTSPKLSKKDLKKYESALVEVIHTEGDLVSDRNYYTRLLLLLVSQIKLKELPSTCDRLNKSFPTLPSPLEFHLRFILDQNIGEGYPSQTDVDSVKDLTEKLSALHEDSPMAKTGQAFTELQGRNYTAAKDLLADIPDDCISGQYFLGQVCLYLHSNLNCLQACKKGLQACDKDGQILCAPYAHVKSLFELARAEAYMEIGTEDTLSEALGILEEVAEKMPVEAFLMKAYIFLKQGKVADAQDCMNYLPPEPLAVQTLQASVLYAMKAWDRALKILQSVVKEDPKDARATLLLGRVLWELRDSDSVDNAKQECFTTLLKAAKLDPYNHKSFIYIGLFYKKIQKDAVKARRCFQKAFDLRPEDDESGAALVDTLIELVEEEQSLKVLEKITTMAPAGSAKWAWLRLGLHQMRLEDPSTAIMSLQSALRADPEDQHVWECLAEAYLQRGSFTASLKAFTKASELDPQSVYCLHQIASIKHTLGQAAEAVQEFEVVLEKSPTYVPALKGISESLMQLAKQNMNQCLDGLAQGSFERAISYITQAASHRPDMSCLWKLMGDACSQASGLAADTFSVPAKLVSKQTQESSKENKVNKLELLQIGSRCYHQALKILPESGSLWHDLGINLFHQSRFSTGDASQSSVEKAAQVVRKAITLEPKEWKHWNALGVIACSKLSHKPALAQHCFIKSIECESSNASAWTNLGAFYLDKGEIKLAHEAFTAAQRTDPTYMACWIGQALIAEIVGHEEAMDLFRHTTELGFHVESAVSYGQWVLSELADVSKRDTDMYRYCIQQMAAVPAARDALTKYTTRVKNDATALNILGLLNEQENLLLSAAAAFNKALEILEGQDDRLNDHNKIKLNLARVLCKQKKFSESAEQYGLCDLQGNVEHLCMYGLALLHGGRLEESLKVYHLALELSQDSPVQSQIHAALGMVAFMQGDVQAAKSYLFDGFQTAQPSLNGLFAFCALGLLQGDGTLASAVLDELYKREDAASHRENTLLLEFYKHLVQGDRQAGEASLREHLTASPADPSLLTLSASITLQTCETDGDTASELAENASIHETDCAKQAKQKLLQSLGQLSAGLHSCLASDKNALKNAQKALHANPGCTSALATLACAVHAEAEIKRAMDGTSHLLTVEQKLLETLILNENIPGRLQAWCRQHLLINALLQGEDEKCQIYQKELLNQHQESPDVKTFLETISKLTSTDTSSGLDAGLHSLSFLVNCSLLATKGGFDDKIDFYGKAIAKASAESNQAVLERAAYETFRGVEGCSNPKMEEQFEDAIKVLKSKEIKSPIASLLQALQTMRKTPENKRLVKHSLATALDHIDTATELGYGSSMLRQQLILLLWDSKKETDQAMVKGLLEDAASKGDTATAERYRALISG